MLGVNAIRNFSSYRGQYLIGVFLARVRCRVDISGSADDRRRARDALVAGGWSAVAHADSDTYVRDIRGSLSSSTIEEVVRHVHTHIVDTHSRAAIDKASLERIRYAGLRFTHRPAPLEHDGKRVDALAEISVAPIPLVQQQQPPPARPPSTLLARLIRIPAFWYDCLEKSARFIARIFRRATPLWFRQLAIRVIADDSARFIWVRFGLLAASGGLGVAAGVAVADRFPDRPTGPEPALGLIGISTVLLLVLGALNLFTRVAVHRADAALPQGYSRWQAERWANANRTDVARLIGAERHHAIRMCWTAGTLVLRMIAMAGAGALLFLSVQTIWFNSRLIAATLLTVGLLLAWILVIDAVRPRQRSGSRLIVRRTAASVLLAGVGGAMVRLPSYFFYQPLGYPAFAFEIGWHDVIVNARGFIMAALGSGALIAIYWLFSPRITPVWRSAFALLLLMCATVGMLSAMVEAGRPAELIVQQQSVTAGGTRYAACLIDNGREQPIWIIGQSAGRFLIGDRETPTGDPTRITNVRMRPSGIEYRIVADATPCR
ncbi:hypothetical protein NONI108955_09180 [Nocardia ninae]|uniref:Uncharacterized protein n=1 Tax=Nocardia ninae NBRC 108245 TaxID=1210091 RepID=A0A511M5R7_9NOCA|nr:hypothetical protein NN4_05120 [Nocardia ninae NBRC 108245]